MRGIHRWLLAGLALVVVGVLVVAVLFLRRTDTTTTEVSLAEAVERFREETGSTTSSSVGTTAAPRTTTPTTTPATTSTAAPTTTTPVDVLPAPGVYRYRTSGGDSIDALGGASHTYPATSTITVRPEGCGVSQRWVAAEERWDELVTCAVPGGVELVSFTAFHRFFGQDTIEPHTCAGEPRPLGAPAGTTWTTHCTIDDLTATWRGTVLGTEQLIVGGQPVGTDHVVVEIDDGTGDLQRTETWYLAGTDLVVRRVVDNATTNPSPIGDVHYREHYEIELEALAPER